MSRSNPPLRAGCSALSRSPSRLRRLRSACPPPPPFVEATVYPPARPRRRIERTRHVLVVIGPFALVVVPTGTDLTQYGWPLIIIPGLTLLVVGFASVGAGATILAILSGSSCSRTATARAIGTPRLRLGAITPGGLARHLPQALVTETSTSSEPGARCRSSA